MIDMKRIRRPPPPPPSRAPDHDPESGGSLRSAPASAGLVGILRTLFLALACFSLALIMISSSGCPQTSSPFCRFHFSAKPEREENALFGSSDIERDRLLGGLLAPGFDEGYCLSRYQSGLLRKQSSFLPSPYLLQRLRKQEALQKKCGPKTEFYNQAIKKLKSGRASGSTECKYVVWLSYSGLGNRMLSVASTFLYAILTNRVLLIDRGADMAELFCEPFPESSWLLPLDFPLQFDGLNINSSRSYGNMLKNKVFTNQFRSDSIGSLPSYAYLHLSHDYDDFDKLFFCEDDQRLLENIPWLLLRSNNYFTPSLFLIPAYQGELEKLFPRKDTVFHHLGRYLFHPTNAVWGMITRYYQSYLSNYEEKVGIQIRVFDSRPGPFNYILDQVLACSLNEKLLPEINVHGPVISTTNISSKTVLVTSLNAGYSEHLRNMYWEYPASTGEIISVHQPSHEGYQQSRKKIHNLKALSEMYLLSSTDVLVTSAWSTFGYVAQGLGGLKPWILFKPENETAPDPPCRRAMSMEPCFHAPPFYDCKAKKGIDTGTQVPHVQHCEDMSWGLKLTDGAEE